MESCKGCKMNVDGKCISKHAKVCDGWIHKVESKRSLLVQSVVIISIASAALYPALPALAEIAKVIRG